MAEGQDNRAGAAVGFFGRVRAGLGAAREYVQPFVEDARNAQVRKRETDYAQSDAGRSMVKSHAYRAANVAARQYSTAAFRSGNFLGGFVASMLAERVNAASMQHKAEQHMFELSARASRGDFEGMKQRDLEALHEHGHKYAKPGQADALREAVMGEHKRRESVKHGARDARSTLAHSRRLELAGKQSAAAEMRETGRAAARAHEHAKMAHKENLVRLKMQAQKEAHEMRAQSMSLNAQAAKAKVANGTPKPPKGNVGKGAAATAQKQQAGQWVPIATKGGGMAAKNTRTGNVLYGGRAKNALAAGRGGRGALKQAVRARRGGP